MMMLRIDFHRWFAMAANLNPKWSPKIQRSSDFGEIWFPCRFSSCELISVIVFWNWEPCYDPSDHIISCYYYYYYYYYSSSSSPNELVRPNSQRLMIRSLPNFTGRWIPISRGAPRSWHFQNGRRCHGNLEHISKSLTSLLSETAEGISTYILSRVGRIFWPKKIASDWPPFS